VVFEICSRKGISGKKPTPLNYNSPDFADH